MGYIKSYAIVKRSEKIRLSENTFPSVETQTVNSASHLQKPFALSSEYSPVVFNHLVKCTKWFGMKPFPSISAD